MAWYCPTCGNDVTQGQKFCSECSTRLSGPTAPVGAPPADTSNAVPHRPEQLGSWGLEEPPRERDDLDDFFSSYRRKGNESSDSSRSSSPADESFPTRRSRRRFTPDLEYQADPSSAASSQGAQPEARGEVSQAGTGFERPVAAPRGERPVEEAPAPIAATPAADSGAPRWFEELVDEADEPSSPPTRAMPAVGPDTQVPAAPAPVTGRAPRVTPPRDGGGEKPFDALMVGGEPGAETRDTPIVSRDFEQTGILPVPQGSTTRPRASEPAASPFGEWFGESPDDTGEAPRADERQAAAASASEPAARRPDAERGTATGAAGAAFAANRAADAAAPPPGPNDTGAAARLEAERHRPWFEQGLDGTERPEDAGTTPYTGAASSADTGWSRGHATSSGARPASAQTSAPSYHAPAGAGADSGARTADRGHGAAVDARGATSGSASHGPASREDVSGGFVGSVMGVLRGLDATARKRLLTIAIALVGSILLILSAVIIGNAIGAREGTPAAETPSASEAAPPTTTEAAPDSPAGPPPAVADPNFSPVAFQSESGNLRCIITPETGVACQHSTPGFKVPASVCKSTGAAGAVVGLDSNGYTFPCLAQDIPRGLKTLPMDTPIRAGEFSCTITYSTGVNCFNAAGDLIGLEYTNGIGTSGRASTSPQATVTPKPTS